MKMPTPVWGRLIDKASLRDNFPNQSQLVNHPTAVLACYQSFSIWQVVILCHLPDSEVGFSTAGRLPYCQVEQFWGRAVRASRDFSSGTLLSLPGLFLPVANAI